ncbi:MAG: phosphatidylinositol kinase [Acidimicrobiia bacterium]|nr:phosphatidylinositol kinase [Acidimicrobiia bacterium]
MIPRATPALRPTETSVITARDWQPYVESVEGRFAEASNATLLGVTSNGLQVVYKPIAGIQPLWDFPAETLPVREVWTYRIDQALGSDVVPMTVMGDGLYGPGAVQIFVEAIADSMVVEMVNSSDANLWPIALLDIITNNADRKAGHILRGSVGELWGIDHGLTFHEEPKLRTILWGFAGKTVPADLLDACEQLLSALQGELGEAMASELSEGALLATIARITALVDAGVHPQPPEHRPAIPWPPY